MKKKLLALVLAIVMTAGCFAGLGAGVDQNADFASLTVEEQYAMVMSMEDSDAVQQLLASLSEDQLVAFTEYAEQVESAEDADDGEEPAETEEPTDAEDADTSEDSSAIPAVNYTNVAPLVTASSDDDAQSVASNSSLMMASLGTDSKQSSPIVTGDKVNGLEMTKTATVNDDGSYTIKLETYTTGTVSTTESTKPTDIVLVLDQSGSMANDMTTYKYTAVYPGSNHSGTYYVKYKDSYVAVSWCSDCNSWTDGCTTNRRGRHSAGNKFTPMTSASDTASGNVQFFTRGNATTTTRIAALKAAVTSFANSVAEKAKGADGILGTDDDVNHRIAVVGFASGNPSNRLYYNSEIFVGATQYQYNRLTSQNYLDAMQSMDTKTGVDNIGKSINALDAEGATYTNLGLEMANGILAANPVADNSRNRIVVVFTDGQPGRSGYDSSVANSAINQAATTKNTYNATVYTVGIFDNADATSAGDQNGTDAQKSNWFMQNMSSNNGTVQDPSYYLSASDAETLSTIFQKISQQISESTIDLGKDTVVKDTVTKYFNVPSDESTVSVTTVDCTGVDENGQPTWSTEAKTLADAKVTIDGSTVNVTGFDFNANYVTSKGRSETDPKQTGNFYGRKLVVEFTVTAKDGFVGGNSVPTNGSDSGVYDKDGTKVATYDVPQVNVPITAELTVNNKVIYEGRSADVSGLYNKVSTTGDDSWKYDYVDVSYDVKNGDTAVSGSVSPADCTDYTVTATYSPKYDGQNAAGDPKDAKTATDTATVHVLKPTVTVTATDVERYYGENYTPTDGSKITGTVIWKDNNHSNISANDAEGQAPFTADDLDFSSTHKTFVVPDERTTIDVIATANGKKVADTTYQVIPLFCTLTINKDVADLHGANDSFIFNIAYKGNVEGFTPAQVVINGAGSATLTGLPIGTYTVTEDTGWSWRYTCKYNDAAAVLAPDAEGDHATVTITNELTDNQYLGDEAYAINKCESKTIKKITSNVIQQAFEFLLGR